MVASVKVMNFKLAVAGTAAVTVALGISRFAYTPILPFMQSDLELSSTELGALASWNFFGYLIGSLIALIRPNWFFTERTIFFLALSLSILTTGLMGLTETTIIMVITRFLAGISSALTLIVGTGLIFRNFDIAGQSNLKLTHFCGFGLGITISALTVPIANKFGFGWSSQWLILAPVCCILVVPTLLFIPRETAYSELPGETKSDRSKSILAFTFVAVGYGLFGLGYIIFGTFISAMSLKLTNLASFGEYVWLIVGITAIPSVFLWQKLSTFIGKDLALAIACVSSAIGIFFAIQFVSVLSLTIGCMLYGAGMPGIVALALLEGKDRYRGSLVSAVAILTLSFSIGQMVGPLLAGFLIDVLGNYFLAMQISVISFFIAGLLMVNPIRLVKQPKIF